MPKIKLQSSDGQCFAVDIEFAMRWKTIKNMLDNLGTDGLEAEIIPLPNVTGGTLGKIVEWAEHYKDEPVVEQEEELVELTDWDREFLQMKTAENRLISLILAANYLDIRLLQEQCCRYAVDLIKGKTAAEVREIIKIQVLEGLVMPTKDTEVLPMEEGEEKKETTNENRLDLSTSDHPACLTKSS